MRPFGDSDGYSAERRDNLFDRVGEWAREREDGRRDRSPIEDPQWPHVTPTFPRRPYRMSEDDQEREPPRSPKKAWPDQPPRSPKDITGTDAPTSPKNPRRSMGRASGDYC